MVNAIKILILLIINIYIYTVMERIRPATGSQMRLGQKLKVHANIALLLEKGGIGRIFEHNLAWLN